MLYNSFCWPAFQDSPLMVCNETTLQHRNTLILIGSLGPLLFFFVGGWEGALFHETKVFFEANAVLDWTSLGTLMTGDSLQLIAILWGYPLQQKEQY